MQFLARCKLIHEKIPTTDPDEIKKYTDRLNKSMGFSGKNIIRPCDLDPCPMKKEHIKGMMNQGISHQNLCKKLPLLTIVSFRFGEIYTTLEYGIQRFCQESH